MGRLYVDFCGQQWVLEPGRELDFGRQGELVVDANPYMHRRLGRFAHRDGHWWLDNLGAATPLQLHDANGPTSALIGPGASACIAVEEFRCAFSVGSRRYEIDGVAEGVAGPGAVSEDAEDDVEGVRTLEWGIVDLNEDQRLLLTVLSEDRLLDPLSSADPPASRACARRLGWSLSKFNRKLDHVCTKLSRVGVDGLYGEAGIQATARRRILVDHALAVGLVTAEDLELLGEPVA